MEEISDSNCENTCHRVNDSCAYSHKYKGVVPQQNGNWGAQIYTNNQRIWIGTFRTELDAAIAYDRASIVLRSSDAPRNFPWNKTTVQEAEFQSLYSKDKILALIKEGSYQAKFDDFLRQRTEKENANDISLQKSCGFSPRPVFEKVLTPSDVGKLNRIVIPKKYAVSYFPPIPDNDQSLRNDDGDLKFFDVQYRVWKFRYCYWKSSQSFVFTRGWNQFVKEKRLMANDTISFYFLRNPQMQNSGYWIIETPSDTEASLKLGLRRMRREEEGSVDDHEMSSKLGLEWKRQKKEEEGSVDDHEMSLKLGLGRNRQNKEEDGSVDNHEMKDEVIQTSNVKTKGFKLFGVEIGMAS